jgi:hypothetical protein
VYVHGVEVVAAIFHEPMYKRDQHIELLRPFVDAITMPNIATALHVSDIMRPHAKTPLHHAYIDSPVMKFIAIKFIAIHFGCGPAHPLHFLFTS